jgi:DNA-binding transcriptional MerR regulator
MDDRTPRLNSDSSAILMRDMSRKRFTIRELAKASGVSVPSIKYYLREGLLPPGDPTAEHRAHYATSHLDRLKAIRALRDVGQLPIATIAGLFQAMERGKWPFAIVASAMDAMKSSPAPLTRKTRSARDDVVNLLTSMGVEARPNAGAVMDLASAIVTLRELWGDLPVQQLRPYAEAARDLAKLETDANRDAFRGDTESLLRVAVLGTVLFEPVLIALRRVMHEHLASAVFRDIAREARHATNHVTLSNRRATSPPDN